MIIDWVGVEKYLNLLLVSDFNLIKLCGGEVFAPPNEYPLDNGSTLDFYFFNQF